MSAHTPGPWRWNAYFEGLGNGVADDNSDGSDNVLRYAPYEGMWLYIDNEEANAVLIAAAPELLAALEALVDADDRQRVPTGTEMHNARAAIAKAKGAQS